jgi:hypothetical protein
LRRLYNDKELSSRLQRCRASSWLVFDLWGNPRPQPESDAYRGVFLPVPEGTPFRDDYVDNFVAHYGEFKAFFLRRQSAKLAGLSRVIVKQIADYQSEVFESA